MGDFSLLLLRDLTTFKCLSSLNVFGTVNFWKKYTVIMVLFCIVSRMNWYSSPLKYMLVFKDVFLLQCLFSSTDFSSLGLPKKLSRYKKWCSYNSRQKCFFLFCIERVWVRDCVPFVDLSPFFLDQCGHKHKHIIGEQGSLELLLLLFLMLMPFCPLENHFSHFVY